MEKSYTHLEGFSNEKLGRFLNVLHHDFKPKCEEKISIGDVVEYRPRYTLGTVCLVEDIKSVKQSF